MLSVLPICSEQPARAFFREGIVVVVVVVVFVVAVLLIVGFVVVVGNGDISRQNDL